ncbi:hypothetical protein [Nocardioides sp. MH1]|uniref:hypothetical protein n=1 Tax=Nocardioides sp. MH1 TaxID=3242490 RepID=UPI003522C5E6
MDDWIELSPWEIAFLAAAPSSEPTPLENVVATGLWLRDPEVQKAGGELFAVRLEGAPALAGEALAALVSAARRMVRAKQAGVVSVTGSHELCLLSFTDDSDDVTQVVLGSRSAAIRATSRPVEAAGVADELMALSDPTSIVACSWDRTSDASFFAWDLADDEARRGPVNALREACAVAGGAR